MMMNNVRLEKTVNLQISGMLTIRNCGHQTKENRTLTLKGYIDVPSSWVDNHGALIVKGDSMYPEYHEGDIVVYRCTPTCENGDDCIVYVNGDDATIKKVLLKENGIILQPLNPDYDPMFFENGEGLTIGGVVVEIRRRKK